MRSLEEGARFTSVSSLLKEFNASRATMDRALKELRESGWLKSIRGKGMYVSRPVSGVKGSLPGIVDYLFFGFENTLTVDSFQSETQQGFTRLLGLHGSAIRTTVLRPESTIIEIAETLERLNPEFVVVVGLYKGDTQLILEDLDIPYILLHPNCPIKLPNSFLVDSCAVVRNWVEHLSGLGHKKIAFLHGIRDQYYHRTMHLYYRYFYEEMARKGLVVDPDLVIYGGYKAEDGYKAMCELFSGGKEFTAVIINDETARGVYQAIEEHGRVIGRDISVIATDDMPWCSHMSPSLTSTRISRNRMAKMLFEQISAIMLSGEKKFENRVIPVSLTVRDSTGVVS